MRQFDPNNQEGDDQGFDPNNPEGIGGTAGSVSATTYLLTGPASLQVAQPATFHVSLNSGEEVDSDVTISLISGGVFGVFSPATVTLPANVPGASASFTFTAETSGTVTILVDNNALLLDPGPLVLQVTGSLVYLPVPYPRVVMGTTGWLLALLTSQMIEINAECAALVKGEEEVVVSLRLGDQRSVKYPTLAIIQNGTPDPKLAAQHTYDYVCRYLLRLYIPQAGDNTSANFEMARQIVSNNLAMLFIDEGRTLRPTINAPPIGPLTARLAKASGGADIFPRKLEDGVTIVTGFEIPWQAVFSIANIPG